MKKQKICIVGGGLSGLVTASALSTLNVEIDLVIGNAINSNLISNRTTAISQENYQFLKKLNVCKFLKKEFWSCSHMKLYSKDEKKFTKIFQINKENKKVLYMVDNLTLVKRIMSNLKKKKSITIKNKKQVSDILNNGFLKSVKFKNSDKFEINDKYNLVILCTGKSLDLANSFLKNEFIDFPYQESSITTILKHSFLKNNTARQIFLDDSILAMLPISNTKTSIVWSIKKNLVTKNNNLFIKNKIKLYTKDFLKNVKFISNIEFKDISLFIRRKYFKDRILLFGDAIHQVHPLAGQGFNMIVRDLVILENILREKINLGFDVGSYDTLQEFSKRTKTKNFIYSVGIDFLKNFFTLQNKPFKNFRNKLIMNLNKSNFVKNIFFNIADRGLKF